VPECITRGLCSGPPVLHWSVSLAARPCNSHRPSPLFLIINHPPCAENSGSSAIRPRSPFLRPDYLFVGCLLAALLPLPLSQPGLALFIMDSPSSPPPGSYPASLPPGWAAQWNEQYKAWCVLYARVERGVGFLLTIRGCQVLLQFSHKCFAMGPSGVGPAGQQRTTGGQRFTVG
jgi:hypothetical protein